jgi:hypothetical protein
MKKINLAEPFEKLSIAVSSLPLTHDGISPQAEEVAKETKVKQLLREIYEVANGRQVATTIGLVALAPPTAPYLKDKPFFVETQADFLSRAIVRMADGASKRRASVPAHRALSSTISPRAQAKGRASEMC